MIVFECPVPIVTEQGVIRDSEFGADAGWSYQVISDQHVRLWRRAEPEQNVPAISPCDVYGYAFTTGGMDAAEKGLEQGDDQQEHRDGDQSGKAKGSSGRHRVRGGASSQEEAQVSGKDRALGKLLG